jgi:hypothetical protein
VRGFRSAAAACALVLLAACAGGPRVVDRPPALAEADFIVDLRRGEGSPAAVSLELRFPAGSPAGVELSFPPRYAFIAPEAPLLVGPPRFRGPTGALPFTQADAFTWRLPGPPERVRVEYEVALRHRELPGVAGRDEYEQPYLAIDHGMLSTAVLLMLPMVEPMRCRVRWLLPEGWAQPVTWPVEDGWCVAPSAQAARNDLVPVGDWRIEEFRATGFTGRILYAPGQRRRLGAHAPVLAEVAQQLVDWMGAPPAPAFGFLFPAVGGRGAGGSPKGTTMGLFLSDEVLPHGREFLAHLGAHEFFHLWGRKDVPSRAEMRWFEEGVTDWVAHRAARAVGGLDLVDEVATARRQVDGAAGAGLSLAEAGGPDFFRGGASYTLCYAGGLLVGEFMDRRLRGRGGLLPVLREWKAPEGPGGESPQPGIDRLVAEFAARAGREAGEELRRLVTEPFDAAAAARCAAEPPVRPARIRPPS